jgi:hypothetical protein
MVWKEELNLMPMVKEKVSFKLEKTNQLGVVQNYSQQGITQLLVQVLVAKVVMGSSMLQRFV